MAINYCGRVLEDDRNFLLCLLLLCMYMCFLDIIYRKHKRFCMVKVHAVAGHVIPEYPVVQCRHLVV